MPLRRKSRHGRVLLLYRYLRCRPDRGGSSSDLIWTRMSRPFIRQLAAFPLQICDIDAFGQHVIAVDWVGLPQSAFRPRFSRP